eukprot:5386529-Pleurochrysis_carterae.AAC.1
MRVLGVGVLCRAGLVRSAASFALARAATTERSDGAETLVTARDFERALAEVTPALGRCAPARACG